MEKTYITATDLMKYVYCPRIIYYIYVLKRPQQVTKKEEKGINKETIFKREGKRTKIVKKYPPLPKIFNVRLSSEELGIRTIADSIMIDASKNEAYPIQTKYSFKPDKIFKTQKIQIMMEGLLIEKSLGYNVPFGFIKFLKSGELVKVPIHDKSDVIGTAEKVKEIIGTERFPKPTKYKNRCVDCCYRKMCWGE
ncbi:MAG: CRISPR-associated protein Cas4 [Candidatus Aenigmarchaeota archaeon]|nr:CRISPR-associated protein Cas4 [Candidatus Aenigmarchaeota archaeon]